MARSGSRRTRSRGRAARSRPPSATTRRRRRAFIVTAVLLVGVPAAAWLIRDEDTGTDDLRALTERATTAADEARQALAGPGPDPDTGPDTAAPGSGAPALAGLRPGLSVQQAEGLLAELATAEPPVAGVGDYRRDDYGERWADIDGNGCNQRDDVLLRDARPETVEVAEQGACDHDVLAGTWDGPYTGRALVFDDLKDGAQAQAITIDHVVPLAEAHRSGAGVWPAAERERFANDLDNLVATDGPTNSDKSDADPAEWRPPERSAWCGYAVVWVSVKAEWNLTVDAAERRGLEELLATC